MPDQIIDVHDLSKTFRGGVRALDALTLTVAPGTIHGLLGPNGAGKTTLIRVLATLLMPDSGTARVGGVDVRVDPGTVRTLIGLAGQYAAVDGHLTGRENVDMIGRLYGLPATEARRQSARILDRIHLSDAADRQAKTYSGGMRRRLDLAASLIGHPQVLFLDEPTTGLDPASRRDVWELIRGLVHDGTTVLLTTQYLDEADQLADHITVIDTGRVIGAGTPEELKATVGSTQVELNVDASLREAALRALESLGARNHDDGPDTILLPGTDGPVMLRRTLQRLDAAGIIPDNIAMRGPTLDDVFLALTGHGTITEPAAQPKDA